MKTYALVLLFTLSCLFTYAQSTNTLDKEKLYEFYQSQRYADAAQYLGSIYGEQPEDQKILMQIAYCYLMAGNNMEAEKYYLQANQREPENLSILFSLASVKIRRGQTEQAKSYYSAIIGIDSNNFNAYKQIANLFTVATDSLRINYLQKANQLNPLEGEVAYDLALVYQFKKENEAAYQVLNQAITADTSNLILQKAKLPIANALKKYDEVVDLGEKILKSDADANVMKNVAIAHYQLKQYQKAIDLFKSIEELALQTESSLYYTTLCYRALKDYKMAGIYAQKTIEEGISLNTADYYALLGLIYDESNQPKLSSAAYKRGLQFKQSPTLYYRLALLYDLKLKDKKSALTYYRLYLKNKPDQEKEKEEITYTKSRIEDLSQPN